MSHIATIEAARDQAFARFEATQPANVEFGDWLAREDRALFEAVSAIEEGAAQVAGWRIAQAEALATGRFGVDPERRGYCYAWKIEYRREQNGRVTRCQGSERTYANRADAEMVADFARRHADPELDRLFGPETITVHLVSTSVCGLTHDVPERFSA